MIKKTAPPLVTKTKRFRTVTSSTAIETAAIVTETICRQVKIKGAPLITVRSFFIPYTLNSTVMNERSKRSTHTSSRSCSRM